MATPRTQPAELHEHAMDNLKYIRKTLERAGSFTAVPGKGGMLMGVVALLAARSAAGQAGAGGWFMFVGTVALLLPGWNDLMLPVGLGGLHLIFGTVIAVKYGG